MDLLADDSLIDLRPRARRPGGGSGPAAVLPPPVRVAVPAPTASPTGACSICGSRLARTVCPSCGLGVCPSDLWPLLGLCKACVSPTGSGGPR